MRYWLAVFAALVPFPALAQSKADPADPKAPAPSLRYESAFTGYKKASREEKPAAWKQVNEEVKPKPSTSSKPAEHKHR